MKEALLVPPRKRFGVRGGAGLCEDAGRKPKVISLAPTPLTPPDPKSSGRCRICKGRSQVCLYIG